MAVPRKTTIGYLLRSEKEKLRLSRYDVFFLPLLVLFVIEPGLFLNLINNGLWMSSFDYSSYVFPVTYVTAIVVFSITMLVSWGRLGIIRSAFYGITLCLGAVGFFEMYFDIFQPNSIPYFHLMMSLYMLSGLVSVKYWKLDWRVLVIVFSLVMGFNAWYLSGNQIPNSYIDAIPLLFNSLTKVMAYLLFFFPYYLGIRRMGRTSEGGGISIGKSVEKQEKADVV